MTFKGSCVIIHIVKLSELPKGLLKNGGLEEEDTMKRKIAYALIAAMSLMIVIGIALSIAYYYQSKDTVVDGEISVTVGNDTTFETEFDLKLSPSESCEYLFRLNGRRQSVYEITLNFDQIKDAGMKSLTDVRIAVEDRVLFEGKLEELLREDETVVFDLEAKDDGGVALRIVYSMSGQVGNEAMGTSVDFDMTLTSKAK